MASVARLQSSAASVGGAGFARRLRGDSRDLANFRARAVSDYERSLSRLIEGEIIPRLMIAHAGDAGDVVQYSGPPDAEIHEADVEALAPLALQVEADLLLAHVEGILERGVSVDAVMVDLLAPAARLLGEYWEDDRCDFVDVTMGLWRLQEVVHEIAARAPADRVLAAGGRRALFASLPGDTHSFGTVVIDEIFCRDGWITERMSGAETCDLVRRVGQDWFDVIGLTVSLDSHIAALGPMIAALRNVSKNSNVSIMVGGRVFCADPDLAVTVGADGTARDAKLALKVAADLVLHREEVSRGRG